MTADNYTEMKKNTVESKDQLKDSDIIRFHNPNENGIKITFIGNSITLHGVKTSIGWYNDFGMAASTIENDYVHVVERMVCEVDPCASFCVCQAAEWERGYHTESEKILEKFKDARDFSADIVIIRLIENCRLAEYDPIVFKNELKKLIDFFDVSKNTRFIITTGFWRHPGDKDIIDFCKENSIKNVELGDLGDDPEMKAIGKFEHSGVANHPGDRGMKAIAQRLFNALKEFL